MGNQQSTDSRIGEETSLLQDQTKISQDSDSFQNNSVRNESNQAILPFKGLLSFFRHPPGVVSDYQEVSLDLECQFAPPESEATNPEAPGSPAGSTSLNEETNSNETTTQPIESGIVDNVRKNQEKPSSLEDQETNATDEAISLDRIQAQAKEDRCHLGTGMAVYSFILAASLCIAYKYGKCDEGRVGHTVEGVTAGAAILANSYHVMSGQISANASSRVVAHQQYRTIQSAVIKIVRMLENNKEFFDRKLQDHTVEIIAKLHNHTVYINEKLHNHTVRINEKLHNHTVHINEKLQSHTTTITAKLQNHTNKITKTFEQESQELLKAFKKTLAEKLKEQSEAFEKKIDEKLKDQSEAFEKKIDEKLKDQSEAFEKKLKDQSEAFDKKIDELGDELGGKIDKLLSAMATPKNERTDDHSDIVVPASSFEVLITKVGRSEQDIAELKKQVHDILKDRSNTTSSS